MKVLYHIAILIYSLGIHVAAICGHPKARLLISGRRATKKMDAKDFPSDPIWVHVASLGEYDQIRPLLQHIRKKSAVKIVLSFYSPSGFIHVKDKDLYDLKLYLPADLTSNMRKLVTKMNPSALLLTKYEIWPNMIESLYQEERPIYLFSALFDRSQIYYKWYGASMKKTVQKLHFIFTQNVSSQRLLEQFYPGERTDISGDLRIQSVADQSKKATEQPKIQSFIAGHKCYIGASIYHYEIESLIDAWVDQDVKIILAPHIINEKYIQRIINKMGDNSYTRYTSHEWNPNSKILILDTIGVLKHVYQYTELAYIGGGFGKGIHNILEPAVYGNRIVFGPKSTKFPEAQELSTLGTAIRIQKISEIKSASEKLAQKDKAEIVKKNKLFFEAQNERTEKVYTYLSNLDFMAS